MADVCDLRINDATEDELWAHGLTLADAIDVLDEGDFRTFPDPKNRQRRYMIGRDRGGRVLTLVIEPVDSEGECMLVTGWPANDPETKLYYRAGGTKYAGRPSALDR